MESERLIDIETKIAHQEHTIEQQNDVIFGQGKRIARLEKACMTLLERLEEMEGENEGEKPADEKPPHY